MWDEDPTNSFLIPPLTFLATNRQVDAASGELLDADIVVNAFQFRWTRKNDANFTSLTGPVDVQSALTFAVGLLIGLNDVPTQGNVMQQRDYPGNTTRRSLTADEFAAALDLYPPSPDLPVTSISGQVTRSGAPVFGAYVAAFKNGTAVVGAVTDASGNYSIRRLPPDAYTIRVMTMKRLVGSLFFSGIDNDFQSQAYLGVATDPGTPVVAVAGTDVPGVNFSVATSGGPDPWEPDSVQADAKMIPTDGTRQIHHSYPAGDADWVKFAGVTGHVYVIETANLGVGSVDSDTLITLTGPSGTFANDDRDPKQDTRASRIAFRATATGDHFVEVAQVDPSAAGSGTAYDISVADLGTAFAAPVVSSVTPPMGPQGGSFQVTVNGSISSGAQQ